jgi:hypothetical protein
MKKCLTISKFSLSPELKADASSVRGGRIAAAAIAFAAMCRAPKGHAFSTPPQRLRLFNAFRDVVFFGNLNLPIARAWTLLHGLRLCPALFER